MHLVKIALVFATSLAEQCYNNELVGVAEQQYKIPRIHTNTMCTIAGEVHITPTWIWSWVIGTGSIVMTRVVPKTFIDI